MPATTIGTGFDEPVTDAGRVFRQTLDALARPGTLHEIDTPALPGLGPAATALALALTDHDTPIWLGPSCRDAAESLRFHCAAAITADPAQAAFALAPAGELPPLPTFHAGTADYPDRSATLIIEVDALGDGPALTLSGPGVRGATVLQCHGLTAGFAAQWRDNRVRYPLGVDVLLTAGAVLCGLPRSLDVTE